MAQVQPPAGATNPRPASESKSDAPNAGVRKNVNAPLDEARQRYKITPSAQNGVVLFSALWSAGQNEEASRFLSQLQQREYPAASDYNWVGYVLAVAGRLPDAEALARKAIRLDANSTDGYLLLAELAMTKAAAANQSAPGVFGAYPATLQLAKADRDKITQLLEEGFKASLVKRATNENEMDAIQFASESSLPLYVILRKDQAFCDLLRQKWLPLRDAQDERLYPGYRKLREVAQQLPGLDALAFRDEFEVTEDLTSPANRPRTNRLAGPLTKLTAQLDEALTVNAAACRTNPNVDCLLISALLNRDIVKAIARKPIREVLWHHLGNTPIPRAWCEDFSAPGSPFVHPSISVGDWFSSRDGNVADPLANAMPLGLTNSGLVAFTLPRPAPLPIPTESGPPARMEHIGPEQIDAAIVGAGTAALRVIEIDPALTAFSGLVEKLLQEVFAAGSDSDALRVSPKDSLDEEAAKNLVTHAYQHVLCRVVRREEGFFLIKETSVGRFELVQFKGPLIVSVSREQASVIDVANGLRWTGGLHLQFASVGRVFINGNWGKWQNLSDSVESYGITHESGRLKMTWQGNARFYRPSPRQINDALSR